MKSLLQLCASALSACSNPELLLSLPSSLSESAALVELSGAQLQYWFGHNDAVDPRAQNQLWALKLERQFPDLQRRRILTSASDDSGQNVHQHRVKSQYKRL